MTNLRNSLWAASTAIFFTGSRFLLTAILARRLTQDAFGQYAYTQWLVDIGFLVCTFGITGVIGRYIAEYRHEPALVAAIMRRWRPFSLGLPFIGAVVAMVGGWLTGLTFSPQTYGYMLCWGLGAGLWGMQTAALTGLQRFDLIFKANLLAAAIMLVGVFTVPITAADPTPVFAIMALAGFAASLIGSSALAQVAQSSPAGISPGLGRQMFTYSINIWITALLWSLVWSRGEVPVVRAMLGDSAVAQYSVALTLYGGAVAGVMLGVGGIAPQITRYLGEGQPQAALALCRRAMDMQLLLSGLGALTLIWLAPELMYYGFGQQYKGSALLLGVLALGLPALALASHNHYLQITTGARYNRNTTLLGVFLLLGFSWVGVSLLGVAGAAWARALTLLVLGAISFWVFWSRWRGQAIGQGSFLTVIGITVLSVLITQFPEFASLSMRVGAWVLLGIGLLLFVKDEAKQPVALYLLRLLWSRLRPAR